MEPQLSQLSVEKLKDPVVNPVVIYQVVESVTGSGTKYNIHQMGIRVHYY